MRRGRNNRIFYKQMAKTIFDYESSDEELNPHALQINFHDFDQYKKNLAKKRKAPPTPVNGFDQVLLSHQQVIQDVQKHCQNKRLKKAILKMDYVRMGGIKTFGGKGYHPSVFASSGANGNKQLDAMYNPSVTNSSSDYLKLPRLYNDPVIDHQFRRANASAVKNLF
jgi:hypothetical protein